MRTVGLPRKVDHLGRVVIPVEFRRLLGIQDGDEVEVTMDGDRLVLARVDPACVFWVGTMNPSSSPPVVRP